MANRIMYRDEAERYCQQNGYKLFLDLCIKEKIILMEKEILTVFTIDSMIGKFGHLNSRFGVIRLEEWPEGLVLWVGGEIRWKSFK